MQVKLVTSARRRRIALKINETGELEFHAPLGFKESDMLKLLRQNAGIVESLKHREYKCQEKYHCVVVCQLK